MLHSKAVDVFFLVPLGRLPPFSPGGNINPRGRGTTKDAYYFSHDSNARHDPKIIAMRSIYNQGYGWYWILVEMMREHDGYKLKLNSKYTSQIYSSECQCASEEITKFIDDCINEFELFESDGEYFWSKSLHKRMERWNDFCEKQRTKVNKRWDKYRGNTVVIPKDTNKVKESKVKESKVKKDIYAQYVSMTKEEYEKLNERFGQQNTNRFIDVLNNYKGSKGKTYKSDYLAILSWVAEKVTGKDPSFFEIKKYPKCPKCNKSWENEIKNDATYCYTSGCNTKIKNKDSP